MRNSVIPKGILLLALTAFLLGGVVVADAVDNQSGKASIVVGKVKSDASDCSGGTADGIADMLAKALANSGKFMLPEKGSIKSGDPKGNDLVIQGSVTKFDTDAGSSGGFGGLKKAALGKVGIDSKEAELELKIRLIDVATGGKVQEMKIQAGSTDWASSMAGGAYVDKVALDGSLSKYADKPMGKAIRTALARMIEKIEKEVPAKYYRHADPLKDTSKDTSKDTVSVGGK